MISYWVTNLPIATLSLRKNQFPVCDIPSFKRRLHVQISIDRNNQYILGYQSAYLDISNLKNILYVYSILDSSVIWSLGCI